MLKTAAQSFAALATLAVPTLANADIVNGSFEADGYTGWSVAKDSVSGSFATAARVGDGTAISMGASLFDHIDGANISNYSSGLPLVAHPTHGNWQALLLQNGPSTTKLSQVVSVPQSGQLTFDLGYHNWDDSFSAEQTFRIQLRNSTTGAVLATVFQTSGALEMPMTHYTVDVSAYSGTDVVLQFELAAQRDFLDVELDNIDLQSAGGGEIVGGAIGDAASDTGSPDMADTADVATAELGGGCSTGRGGASLLAALALVALRRRRR
jgi:hypothetical protein